MFNRNLNGRQFETPDLGLSLDTGPAPSAGAPTHRRKADAIRLPLAGGEFIADGEDKRYPAGSTTEPRTTERGMSMGHWISQSAQTVLPGGASWDHDDEGNAMVSFQSKPENERQKYGPGSEGIMIEGGYHGTKTYPNGSTFQGVGRAGDVSVYDLGDVGFTTETHESTGARVREIQARHAEQRAEQERKDLL